jgi:hypothetical protein
LSSKVNQYLNAAIAGFSTWDQGADRPPAAPITRRHDIKYAPKVAAALEIYLGDASWANQPSHSYSFATILTVFFPYLD